MTFPKSFRFKDDYFFNLKTFSWVSKWKVDVTQNWGVRFEPPNQISRFSKELKHETFITIKIVGFPATFVLMGFL